MLPLFKQNTVICDWNLMNETAIVTGSSRGIGRETAIILLKRGYNVVLCSRTQTDIDSTVREIKQMTNMNDKIVGVRCDVSSSLEVDHLIKSTIDRFKSIDILINNAGIVYVKKLVDTSEHEWDRTIDINLKGTFLCTRATLPIMIGKRSGVIINVSSGAGKTAFPNISDSEICEYLVRYAVLISNFLVSAIERTVSIQERA
jgi:NAD(P)-dependent dehydrogenase (short-subunit alcohol dehydrogenase family)